MNETAVTVDDAAKNFLHLLDFVERSRTSAALLRDGKHVATLTPVSAVAQNCAELAERWLKFERLSPEESEAFASDIEQARSRVPALKPAWD